MKKIISFVMILALLSGIVIAKDLSDYPDLFIDGDELNVVVVVGDQAPANHVLAQTEIALSLTGVIGKRVQGLTKLASKVDEIEDINIISIGSACDNNVTAAILENPEPCDKGLEAGKATIELFESGDSIHIVLNAYSDKGIKNAASTLSNSESYNLEGDLFEIVVFDEIPEEVEEPEVEENDEDERQKLIDELSRKIKDNKEEKSKDIPIIEEPEPIVEEEVNLIKKIISWFLSLFGKK